MTLAPTDPLHEVLGEVHLQTWGAERAWADYLDLRERWRSTTGTDRIQFHDEIALAVDRFVMHVVRLANLLYPKARKTGRALAEKRATRLRDFLGLSDNHTLAAPDSRALRDGLMHFDERMDQAIELGLPFSPHAWLDGDVDDQKFLDWQRIGRCFFVEVDVVSVFGARTDLKPLREAVADVRARLESVQPKLRHAAGDA